MDLSELNKLEYDVKVGNAQAKFNFAELLLRNNDLNKAKLYYTEACELCCGDAAYRLGELYAEEDISKAIEYYIKSVELGTKFDSLIRIAEIREKLEEDETNDVQEISSQAENEKDDVPSLFEAFGGANISCAVCPGVFQAGSLFSVVKKRAKKITEAIWNKLNKKEKTSEPTIIAYKICDSVCDVDGLNAQEFLNLCNNKDKHCNIELSNHEIEFNDESIHFKVSQRPEVKQSIVSIGVGADENVQKRKPLNYILAKEERQQLLQRINDFLKSQGLD